MTKNALLLTAAAVAVLSSSTAVVAGTISGSNTFTGVTSATATGAYKLAKELRFSASATTSTAFAATQGNLTYNFLPTNAGGFTNGESLLLTLDVTGGQFTSATTSVVTATGSGCTASVSAASPVAFGATTATYFVSLTGCTSTSTGLSITLPVQVTGANAVSSSARLQSSFGGQLFDVDGGKVSAVFITSTAAYTATIVTGTATNVADVTQQYKSFTSATTNSSTATVALAVDTSVKTDLGGTSATASDITGGTIVATVSSGTFTGFNLTASGAFTATGTATTATVSTVRTIAIPASATGTVTINVTDNTATGTASAATLDAAIPASSITLAVNVDLANTATATTVGKFVDFTVNGAAYAVTSRNGASFVAPWVALGSTSSTSAIRLGNNGSQPTGPITAVLLSDNGTANPTTTTVTVTQAMLQAGTLNAQGGIDAGDVVTIAAGRLAASGSGFGTTAANGDVQISIESVGNVISAKVRATQSSGQIFESSLGNLSN